MWLRASNLRNAHGFSTRHGGVSTGPFASLNLGGGEDREENIEKNRVIALRAAGIDPTSVCRLKQVHGITVCSARPGIQEGDAIVTDQKKLALVVSIADCYPLLFEDTEAGVIGAAHAGWRGTVGGIAAATIDAMERLGAKAERISVAIGQGISCAGFPVGHEVLAQFQEKGFGPRCFSGNHIDLSRCNREVLQKRGVLPENICSLDRCTTEPDFFSYRRDKGITGRMWALISMTG